MRVLIINTAEKTGGAAIAARRLMEALKNNGIQAKMLVRDKQTDNMTVIPLQKSWKQTWNFLWERIIIWINNGFNRNNLFAVDIANTGTDITHLPEFVQADVIHLHWVNQGMLSLKNIQQIIESGKPVVWTMHDMWPITGICHHAGTCTKYTDHCNHCELLRYPASKDLSYRVFTHKQQLYARAPLTFVACSIWLQDLAKQSVLTEGQAVINIPNPINTHVFKPMDRFIIRQKLQLPSDKKLLLFGSAKISDKKKGIEYMIEACHIIRKEQPEIAKDICVIVLGSQAEAFCNLFPFPIYNMNYVSKECDLVDIYNVADLYVTPSLQENLPNTIVEAMSCGLPCVGFQIGGIPQMIDHLHNGYVAQYKSAADLAHGIVWALTEGDYEMLSQEARRKAVSSYSEDVIARKYIQVYNQITGDNA